MLQETAVGQDPPGDLQGRPGTATAVDHPSPPAQGRPVSPEPGGVASTRLAAGQQALRDAGFSATVAQRISAPQARSTLDLYQGKWNIFSTYCRERDISPLNASVPQIADFLNHLFEDKGYKPSTIDGYRVAIAGALKHLRGVNVGRDPSLSDLSTWMHRERPRGSSSSPPWDLKLVLLALQEPPFEPIQDSDKVSLKHLSWKCAFLTLLASGGRRGEVHALDYKSISHDPKWRFISVRPHPDFISKTQIRSRGATRLDSFTIHSICDFVGPDLARDRKLCPVRCIKAYLARTQGLRTGKRLLFVSYKPEFDKDIHKNTISGWIRKLICYCYANASADTLELAGTSTHAIRGMAATLAFRGSADLEDVLSTCSWASQTTFTDFYLKDVSVVQGDLSRLGPLSVAQHVVQ